VPWQTYQTKMSGRLALSPTPLGGENLYKGNALSFEYVAPYVDIDTGRFLIDDFLSQEEFYSWPAGADRSRVADDFLREAASADISGEPMRYLRKMVLRVAAYLSPMATPLGVADLYVEDGMLRLGDYRGNFVGASQDWLPFVRHGTLFFIVLFAVPLGLLANLKHVLAPSPMRPFATASLIFILANIGVYALISAETRYRLYLDPLLILWAWIAVAKLFERRADQPGSPRSLASA